MAKPPPPANFAAAKAVHHKPASGRCDDGGASGMSLQGWMSNRTLRINDRPKHHTQSCLVRLRRGRSSPRKITHSSRPSEAVRQSVREVADQLRIQRRTGHEVRAEGIHHAGAGLRAIQNRLY